MKKKTPDTLQLQRKELCEGCERYLKTMRTYLGWKQRDLARLVGTTHRRISEIETGKAKISWTLYLAFHSVFSLSREAVSSPVYPIIFSEDRIKALAKEYFRTAPTAD